MPVKYGTQEYWKREKEIRDWEIELQHGFNTKQERREIIVIIADLKDALERDTYGKLYKRLLR